MNEEIKQVVRERYAAVARSGFSHNAGRVARAFGYSAEELASIPANANMGLSCGNPTATANLRPGEVVVDLGSGGGMDVFLAAQKVGPTGKAIGIDMTPEMVERAHRAAQKAGFENVEFHLAEIESMPIPAGAVDCVMSNCVLNLVPDKRKAFAEIFRILKPGGRLAVSDIALKQALPAEISKNLLAYVGCVAGAISIDDYQRELASAGFQDVALIDSGADLAACVSDEGSSGCCSSQEVTPALPEVESCRRESNHEPFHDELADLIRRYNVNDFVASIKVFAVKPA